MFPTMTHMLDKLVVKSLMPREYEYLHHVYSTRVARQARVSVIARIKASLRASTGVPLVPGHGQAYVQTTRQTDNEQSQHFFYLLTV